MDRKYGYGFYFKRINIDIQKYIQKELSCYDLTKSQLDILHYLKQHTNEFTCQKDLQDFMHVSNATINGLVNRLEQKGYVERTRSTKDKRVIFVKQTKKADEIHVAIHVRIKQLEQKMVKNVSKEEQDLLFQLLERVIQNIEMEDCSC